MPYIVYRNADKVITGVYGTQAQANAGATTGHTAHNGNILTALRGSASIDAVNVTANGDWWYDVGGAVKIIDHDPAISEDLRRVATQAVAWVKAQAAQAQEYVGEFPKEDIDVIDNIEWRVMQGLYAVGNDLLTVNPALTTAQKIAFYEETPKGATDISDVYALLVNMTTLRNAARADSSRAIPPSHPVVWVDPRNGQRQPMANVHALSLTTLALQEPPSRSSMAGGTWPNLLTT